MTNYIHLRNQIQKLQKEAEVVRKREQAEIIAKIKEAIVAYGLTLDDLGLANSTRGRQGRKAGKKTVRAGLVSDAKRRGRPTKKTPALAGQSGYKMDKKSAGMDKRHVVAPKYRDVSTGTTWTGRGKQPNWLKAALKSGKKLEDFKI